MWKLWKRKQRERELDEEIAYDLALNAEERAREGVPLEEAVRASRRDFGNVALVKEETRGAWGWLWIEVLGQDLRYGARTLRKNPAFTAMAIAALAVGIGVNTACFTIFDRVAFRPLQIPDGDRIVAVSESFHGQYSREVRGNARMLSYPELAYYAEHNHVFTQIAAFAAENRLALGGPQPETISGHLVTGEYFRLLSGHAAAGRMLMPEDSAAANAVVVLSYGFWQRRFGGDPAVVGTVIRLNQTPLTVVGVMATEFRGTGATSPDVWLPLSMQPEVMPGTAPEPRDFRPEEQFSWLTAIARLKPGVTARTARADLAVLAAQIDKKFPGRITEVSVVTETLIGNPEARIAMLMVGVAMLLVVGLVLLVACANVANLLLARAAARQREMAVRLAIGASRGRVVRQLLTESAMIALAGGLSGLLLARWSLKIGYNVLVTNMSVPRVDLGLDSNVLLYTVLLSAAACLTFGLLPALQATSPDLSSALKDEGAVWGSRLSKVRLRGALMAMEVAVSMALLLSTGLLVRGILRVQALSGDLHLENYTVTTLDLQAHKYSAARAVAFRDGLRRLFDRVPGASSAMAVLPPFGGTMITSARLEGQPQDRATSVNFYVVTPEYFETMSMRPTRGRTFTAAEALRGDPVVVINQAMARRFWPGQDPLGRRFSSGPFHSGADIVRVVGVVKDARSIHLWEQDGPVFYAPMGPKDAEYISVITKGPKPGFLAPGTVQQMVRSLDPAVLASTRTLADNVEHEALPVKVSAAVAAVLGGLALLLAVAGIYCVVTYSVSQRTREIGIRITLGAERRNVIGLMLADHMRPVFAGMVGGAALGVVVSTVASKALMGVSPLDPLAFLGVAAFVTGVALLASYIPARRATKVDPSVALRYE
jgi:macrolide transport system ATP-binding/permease protein